MSYFIHAEKVALWSVLALFALIPFFFFPVPWMSVAASKMLIAVLVTTVATVSWAATALRGKTLRFPRSFLLVASVFVPLAYIVSALATGASRGSLVGSVEQDTVVAVVIWYALFVVGVNMFGWAPSRIVTALRLFFAGSAALLLIQIVHLFFPSLTFGGVLVGASANVVGNWHDLAIVLGLLFFLSLTLLNTPVANTALWRAFLIVLAIGSGLMLLLANVADVWLGLGALALFYAVYLRRNIPAMGDPERARVSQRILVCIVIAIAAVGLYWGGGFIQARLPASLQVTELDVRPSWKGTFAVGRQVFSEAGSVFFGSGPNTFPQQWGLYKPLSVNQTQFWNTDFYLGVGFIPTSLVTVGILGLLAWGAVMLALLLSIRRAFGKSLTNTNAANLRGALVGGAAYLTALHVLYTPGPAISALTFLSYALLVADELHTRTIRDVVLPLSWETWRGRIYSALVGIFALVVLVAGVQALRAIVSESLVNRAIVSYGTSQDLSTASRSISFAIAIDGKNDRAHRAAVELGILQLSRLATLNDQSEVARAQLQSTLTATIQHGLTAISIEDSDYQNWLSLAYLYNQLAGVGVEGAADNARSAYLEAKADNPTNPLPLMGLAQLDLLAKNDAAAKVNLQAVLALKPDFAAAHYLLSQIEARANDLKAAFDSAATAVRLVPEDPLGWYNVGTILYAGGDYANATAALERAVGLQNSYANALFILGLSYYKQGRAAESLAAMQAVAALNPNDAAVAKIVADLTANKDPFAPTPVAE